MATWLKQSTSVDVPIGPFVSNDMRPPNTFNDFAHCTSVDGHVLSDTFRAFPAGVATANLTNEVVVELSERMTNALLAAVSAEVLEILRACAPAQVGKRVVRRIAIVMKRLMSIWHRADESLKYEVVNVSNAVTAKVDYLPTILVVGTDSKSMPFASDSPSVVMLRPDRPVATNSVTGVFRKRAIFNDHPSIVSRTDQAWLLG